MYQVEQLPEVINIGSHGLRPWQKRTKVISRAQDYNLETVVFAGDGSETVIVGSILIQLRSFFKKSDNK